MHPIAVFGLKSPSSYTRARKVAISSILVHSLNVTSSCPVSYFFVWPLSHPAGQFVFSIFSSHEEQSRTPKPSDHPSRRSFETVRNQPKIDITQAPKNLKDAKDRVRGRPYFKSSSPFLTCCLEKALIRDNWKCFVTGIVHKGASDQILAQLDRQATVAHTGCAHIIPEAKFFGVNPKSVENSKLDYFASVLAVLKRFRYDVTSFNREKVNSLTNVITMQKDLHDEFVRLEFYFERTDQENCYEAKYLSPFKPYPQMRQFVTFSTEDSEHLPVPAPGLLALHATCSKVTHLSGASEYIESIYCDADKSQ
ncbi:hypothetical protein B0F90DRAFT_592237 [Multifurca ochricompacta]|uniref:HNH nuclease domain-containing protein n=1 Tax=Multifurca ochricompacta TaxID=376703 RepID=A0AAD4LWV7_9AGAM|nr:hypothetical protein B0F90DRAFT_592237 [Multifurca ochricompacta]